MRTSFALAAGMYLALTAVPAFAGGSSSRGYGGTLNVGPNFEQGGQHTPPVYGTKPAKKRAAAKPQRETPKAARKAPSKKDTTPDTTEQKSDQASSSVAPSADPTDSGTTTGTSTSTGTATSTATTCKRFDSTAGQTITVPCQ